MERDAYAPQLGHSLHVTNSRSLSNFSQIPQVFCFSSTTVVAVATAAAVVVVVDVEDDDEELFDLATETVFFCLVAVVSERLSIKVIRRFDG